METIETEETTNQTVETPVETKVATPSPPKRSTQVLSPQEINKTATALRKEKELPTSPGKSCTFTALDEWLQLLSLPMWDHVSIYVYRTYPYIIRKLANPDAASYIDIITKETVEGGLLEYIKRTHGGGKFKFIVNDTDSKKGAATVTTSYLDIPVDEVLPILDYKELDLNAKSNIGYINILRAKGILNAQGEPMAAAAATAAQGNAAELAGQMGQMFNQFMSQYTQLNKDSQATINRILADGNSKKEDSGLTQLFLERMKQDDPNKQLQMLMNMMTLIKPKEDTGISAMFTQIIQMQQESSKNNLEMLKMMMQQQNQKPEREDKEDGFISGLMKFAKLKQTVPELFGGGGAVAGKPTTAETIVDAVKEIGLPVLGVVSQLIQANTGKKPIVPVTTQQAHEVASNFGANTPMSSLPAPSGTREVKDNVIPMPANTPQGEQPQLDPNNLTICQKFLLQYGNMILTPIKGGMNGVELGERMNDLTPMLGSNVYLILKEQGKDEILKAMRSIPEFWSNTGGTLGDAYMDKLVTDFLDWENLIGDDDEEPEVTK